MQDHEIFGVLDSPEQEGYIRMRKPSVFIFPGGKGDSAFFCVDDYTVLVNGGSLNKPWFWRLIRHYCRLDCMISTHLGSDSLVGLNSLFTRKVEEQNIKLPADCNSEEYKRLLRHLISPEMGLFFVNFPKNLSLEDARTHEEVAVVQETMKLTKKLNMMVRPLACKSPLDPITLFMKAGVGKLDLYPLLPEHNSKELAHIHDKYGSTDKFSTNDGLMSDLASICCLLVWHPEAPQEKIVRVLFPGNAKQEKILESFDKLKQLDFLRHPQPTPASLKEMKKKAATATSKPSSAASKRTTTTSSVSSSRSVSSAPTRKTSAAASAATKKTTTTTKSTTNRPTSARPAPTKTSTATAASKRPNTVPTNTRKPTDSSKPASATGVSKSAASLGAKKTTTKSAPTRPASATTKSTTTSKPSTNGTSAAAKKSSPARPKKTTAAPTTTRTSTTTAAKSLATKKPTTTTTAGRTSTTRPSSATTKKTTATKSSKPLTTGTSPTKTAKKDTKVTNKAKAVEKPAPAAPTPVVVDEKTAVLHKRPTPEGEDGDREKVFIEAAAKPPALVVEKPALADDKSPCGDYLSLDANEDPSKKPSSDKGTSKPDVVSKDSAKDSAGPDVVASKDEAAKQEPDVVQSQVPDVVDEPAKETEESVSAPAAAKAEPDLLKDGGASCKGEPDVVQADQPAPVSSTFIDDIGDGLMKTPLSTSSGNHQVVGNDDTVIVTDDLLTPQDGGMVFGTTAQQPLEGNMVFDASIQQQAILNEDGMIEPASFKPADLMISSTLNQQHPPSEPVDTSNVPPSPLNPDAIPFKPISPSASQSSPPASATLPTNDNYEQLLSSPMNERKLQDDDSGCAAGRLDLSGVSPAGVEGDDRLHSVQESPMSCGSTTTDGIMTSPMSQSAEVAQHQVPTSPLVMNATYARDMNAAAAAAAVNASTGVPAATGAGEAPEYKFEEGGEVEKMTSTSSSTLSRHNEDSSQVARIDSPQTTTDDSAFTSYMMNSLSANFATDEILHPSSSQQLNIASSGGQQQQQMDDNGNEMLMTSPHQQASSVQQDPASTMPDTSSIQQQISSPPGDMSSVVDVPPHYNDSDVSPTAPLAGCADLLTEEMCTTDTTTSPTDTSTVAANTQQQQTGGNPFLDDFSSSVGDSNFVLEANKPDPQMPAVTTSRVGMKKKPTTTSALGSGDKKSANLVNYIDLTYVPHHAHQDFVGKNFFQKVRSRYYVLSGIEDECSTQVLDGLLDGVKSWKESEDFNVTVIPTQDSASLAQWFEKNFDDLESANIHMVTSHCKVFMHNETIEACKIEF